MNNDVNSKLEEAFLETQFLDLTHPLNSAVPTWSGSCGFEQKIKMDYDQGCRVQNINMHAGVGTHMDAPSHFIPNASSIADIALQNLIVPISVIDFSDHHDPKYQLSTQDILKYEANFGKIRSNSLVIAYSGWDKFWSDSKKYRNEDPSGLMVFPSISKDAAELLVERNIAGIGIDTLSPDRPDTTFPVHHIVLGAGKYIVENLANCSRLPPQGAYAIVCPMRLEGSTESAVRAIALVPKQKA